MIPIRLSDHFTCRRLLRFTIPSMVMMIFTSIYGMVDGIFVSNYVGKTAFAAVNLIMPFPMILAAIGFMVGTGGSALIAKTMGEGDREKANRLFSMLVYGSIIVGVLLTVIGVVLTRPVAVWLGATGQMLEDCVTYGRILMISLAPFILRNEFQSFCSVAEKPRLGLAITVAAGLTNVVLDALFVAVLPWGLAGATAASTISSFVGGVIPLVYFALPNRSALRLTRAGFDKKALLKSCTNGSSELVSNLSLSLVNILYNFQLIKLAGEDGVAAYGVIMYVNFIFIGVFMGYAFGVTPVVGYHYGAGNHGELQSLRRKSLAIVLALGVMLTALAELFAGPLSGAFVGYDAQLMEMTKRGFMLYSVSFLLLGFNLFGSAFFTALGNGLISALISFLRTFFFQIAAILILPAFLKLDGIWLSIVAAELVSLAVTVVCFVVKQKEYHY